MEPKIFPVQAVRLDSLLHRKLKAGAAVEGKTMQDHASVILLEFVASYEGAITPLDRKPTQHVFLNGDAYEALRVFCRSRECSMQEAFGLAIAHFFAHETSKETAIAS